mgnify:CR=1 FL=1
MSGASPPPKCEINKIVMMNMLMQGMKGKKKDKQINSLIAEFFNDDRLILITAFSGLSLILGGLSVQHQALLRRTLQFKNLAIADVVSRVLASIIVVIWALKTNSYWSLVFLPILTSFFF